MNDDNGLKQQLRGLKVMDLKHIATQCNLRTAGKKADLVDRLSDPLVATQVLSVLQNIAYGEYAPLGPPTNNGDHIDSKLSVGGSTCVRAIKRQRRVDQSYPEVPLERGCICRGVPPESILNSVPVAQIIQCPQCKASYHDRCLSVLAEALPDKFLCPRCRLESFDPFYPIMKILHLIHLFDSSPTGLTEESSRALPLVSPNIHDLRRKGCEVFIFCFRLANWQNVYLHEWPLTLTATINQNVEKIRKPEYEHKRRDVPMKVTPYLFGDTPNEIKVSATNSDNNEQWAIAVVLCGHQTIEQLEAMILAKNRLPYVEARARTKANIDKFFGKNAPTDEDDDDGVDILDTSCKLCLIDPITLTRIRVPVRGRNCLHLQCFDLSAFLTVTRNTKAFNNRWKCVECNCYVRPKDLVVDTYIEELLNLTSPEAEQLIFDFDGRWEELKQQFDGVAEEEEDEDTAVDVRQEHETAVVDLDDDDDDETEITEVDRTKPIELIGDDEANRTHIPPPPPPPPKEDTFPHHRISRTLPRASSPEMTATSKGLILLTGNIPAPPPANDRPFSGNLSIRPSPAISVIGSDHMTQFYPPTAGCYGPSWSGVGEDAPHYTHNNCRAPIPHRVGVPGEPFRVVNATFGATELAEQPALGSQRSQIRGALGQHRPPVENYGRRYRQKHFNPRQSMESCSSEEEELSMDLCPPTNVKRPVDVTFGSAGGSVDQWLVVPRKERQLQHGRGWR